MPTRRRSRTVCLQGEPGSGKSMMAGATAVNKPVHFVDIDRKILSAAWAIPLIDKGELTVWELDEPIDATAFGNRIRSLVSKSKPPVAPKGWINFGEYFNDHSDPAWKESETVVIDSATILNEHLKTFIMYAADRGKFTFDQWNALKIGWMDTMSALRDLHREHNKDLIFTVHERDKGQPGDRTTGVKTESQLSGGEVSFKDVYQGIQDIKVWASIDGAFGDLIGAHMDEYYYLYVDASDIDNPKWRCRIHPDGKRSLRTSFIHKVAVHNPNFQEIWK